MIWIFSKLINEKVSIEKKRVIGVVIWEGFSRYGVAY